MFWLWLLLFGVAIGVVSGLLGIGGGVLLIPGLILLFGFSQAEAQGTSLAVMIPPIGIFATVVYYQHGYVRFPVVGFIAVGFMLGAYIGARFVPHLSPTHLRLAFGILLLYLGFAFVSNPSGRKTTFRVPTHDASDRLGIRFGPVPLFHRSVRYDAIEHVEVGRTLIIESWGIHGSVRGGWVWNLWGRDCVVVEMTKGTLRIGTDVDRKAKVIHFRSASRAGHSDLGKNRARMEQIREAARQSGSPAVDRQRSGGAGQEPRPAGPATS